jgi:hypothetical protein
LQQAGADGLTWAGGVVAEFWAAHPIEASPDQIDYYLVFVRHRVVAAPAPAGTAWLWCRQGMPVLVHHSRVLHAAPYVVDGDNLRTIFAMYVKGIFG